MVRGDAVGRGEVKAAFASSWLIYIPVYHLDHFMETLKAGGRHPSQRFSLIYFCF